MRPPVVETPDVKVPATPVGSRFFKAVDRAGFDFHSGTVRWLPADGAPIPEGGWLVEHPKPGPIGAGSARGYLSSASVETDCTGFLWPARLLLVEPVGAMWTPHPDEFPRKRAAHAWRVVRELPAWRLFGPQGRQVAAIIEQTAHLTSTQIEDLSDAWDAAQLAVRVDARLAAYDATCGSARLVAYGTARDTALGAAQLAVLGAVRDVVIGWLVKDLISVEDFRTLTGPWEQVVGRVIA
ncbi:hypothetical protein [Propionibacterium freudenreichii]|uniref:hypothetical protein n=1 Tax=Propionibacterium freudenreichii TaxID=1744 RepID=UPI0021A62508|nr:hypothetical protein [Propionibacterium freudenreichii]